MMRITLLVPTLLDGGVTRVIVDLANLLVSDGHAVDILVLSNGKGPYNQSLNRSVRLIPMDIACPWSSRGLFLFFILSLLELLPDLRRYMRNRKPDVVILNHFVLPFLLISRCCGFTAKTISILHGTFSLYVMDVYGSVRFKFIKGMYRFFGKALDALVGVSHGVAEDFRGLKLLPPDKIHVIYNPVVGSAMKMQMRHKVSLHPWFLDRKIPVLLSVGRFASEKNQSLLLEAFALLRRERNVLLVMFGDGPERSKLEELRHHLGLDDIVDMPGFTSVPLPHMAAADVLVLSSIYEGLAMVLVEALACGTNVVAVDCPNGPREILDNGKYGYLVPPQNPEALAVGILNALDNPLPASFLRERAEHFSGAQAKKAYTKLLNNLLAR